MNEQSNNCELLTKSLSNKQTELVKSETDDLFALDDYSSPEVEAINYLRQMIKLSKRKIKSKKIINSGKVRWARAGIEASKILLYSGVIEKAERRKEYKEKYWLRDAMQDILKKKMG